MYRLHFFLALFLVAIPAQLEAQKAFRVNGINPTLEDLDPNDGVDFVSQFSGSWSLKFATPAEKSPPISNTIVGGGSRTVYSGVRLTDLSFDTDFGIVDLVDLPQPGEYVFWDRAEAGQHIVELCFQIGKSSVRLVLIAESTDLAFNQLFNVNTPNPNTGELDPIGFSSKSDAELSYTQPELLINAALPEFGAAGSIEGGPNFLQREVLLGDVNLDDKISLLDVDPFVALILSGEYQAEADING